MFKSLILFDDIELERFFNMSEDNYRVRNLDFDARSGGCQGIEQLMLHDVMHYMTGDILKKVDMSTMSKSLEGREPFLDHKLFDFLA